MLLPEKGRGSCWQRDFLLLWTGDFLFLETGKSREIEHRAQLGGEVLQGVLHLRPGVQRGGVLEAATGHPARL